MCKTLVLRFIPLNKNFLRDARCDAMLTHLVAKRRDFKKTIKCSVLVVEGCSIRNFKFSYDDRLVL